MNKLQTLYLKFGRFGVVSLLAAGALLLASCATTPKTAAPTQPPAPTPQTTKPATPPPNTELQKAKDLKQEVDQYQLGSLVPDTYKKANDELSAGEQAMGSDNATAKSKLDAAIADYQTVLSSGFPMALKQEQASVAKAKDAADAVKADKAAPDLYKQAQDLEQQAMAKEKANAPTDAYALYKQAAEAYGKSEAAAKQKRAAAEAALKQADEQIGQAKSKVEEIQKNLESSTQSNSTSGSSSSSSGGGQ